MRFNGRIKLLIFIIALIIFLGFGRGYYNNFKEKRRLKVEKSKLETELSELQSKLENINYDLENSDSLQFIEKEARALGMIKPGETIIIDMDKEKGGKKENKND